MKGKIVSINTSKKKGGKKSPVPDAVINKYGIEGDGHSGDWHRQISLLSMESITEVNNKGVEASPGDFAENLTVSGMNMTGLKIGDRLEIKDSEPAGKSIDEAEKNEANQVSTGVILEVTQIGKECLHPCRIYYQMGSCIMPEEGIFCRIIKPGRIAVGDMVDFLK
ncbi:MAG: MOSC domain-containing protein [Actinomycetia bacterium]|nr:MOSC domain-containing protein [Actinomycetes bacterium]